MDDVYKLVERGLQFGTVYADPPWNWSDEGDADQLGRTHPDATLAPSVAFVRA